MLFLDTNHYSEFVLQTPRGERLRSRIVAAGLNAFLTVVTAEEVTKGWLAAIQPHRHVDRGVRAYRQFQESLTDLARWDILPWSSDAADIFDSLKAQRVRAGTLDLRIAAIALEYNATVLTRNLLDFQHVSGLHVENWLD